MRLSFVLLGALALVACGDSEDTSEACVDGMAEGEVVGCSCGDAQAGFQVCEADGLSECDCVSPLPPELGGPAVTGGTGGMTMTVTGGTGGMTPPPPPPTDGGMMMVATDGGGMMMMMEPTLPNDGEILSTCEQDSDCNGDLACRDEGNGPSYCTNACADNGDADCQDGATCSTGSAICRYECTGTDDTGCPDMMECISVGGGAFDIFRCAYPEMAPEPGAGGDGSMYAPCGTSDDADCEGSLNCSQIYGHCTDDCTEAADCAAPGSGELDPSCSSNNGCRFQCDPGDVCPDGLECDDTIGRCVNANGGGTGGLPGGGGLPGAGFPGM